jgi:hypothetical protein
VPLPSDSGVPIEQFVGFVASCLSAAEPQPSGASDLAGAVVVSVVFVGQVREALIGRRPGQPSGEEFGHRDAGDEAVFELPTAYRDWPMVRLGQPAE